MSYKRVIQKRLCMYLLGKVCKNQAARYIQEDNPTGSRTPHHCPLPIACLDHRLHMSKLHRLQVCLNTCQQGRMCMYPMPPHERQWSICLLHSLCMLRYQLLPCTFRKRILCTFLHLAPTILRCRCTLPRLSCLPSLLNKSDTPGMSNLLPHRQTLNTCRKRNPCTCQILVLL